MKAIAYMLATVFQSKRKCIFRLVALVLIFASLSASTSAIQGALEESTRDFIRQQALFALQDILEESKRYDDQALRVRVKAQVADILWPINVDQARDLIKTALTDISNLQEAPSARYALRAEVIGVARRHDPRLASKLIGQLPDKAGETREFVTRDSVERISARGAIFLESAREFFRTGDQEAAIASARNSIAEGRSLAFLSFLNDLRERDPSAADKLFLEAVASVRRSSDDPNAVLLLGLYLFSPGKVYFTNVNGQLIVGKGIRFSSAPVPPVELLSPYLKAADAVMARFFVIPGQPGSEGLLELKRSALQQLLPIMEAHLPERAAAMRAQLATLGVNPAGPTAPQADPVTSKQSVSFADDSSTNDMIKEIEKVVGTRQRDNIYFETGVKALERGDFEKARTLISRVSTVDLKQSTLELIGLQEARKAIQRGELGEASRIASAQLTGERLALISYNLAAAWLQRGDIAEAISFINASAAQAAKIEDKDQRAKINIYLAGAIVKRDTNRAFEFIETSLRDIDSLDVFDLNSARLAFRMTKPLGATYEQTFPSGISLLSILPELAHADPYRVLGIARSLRTPLYRSQIIITFCRGILTADKSRKEGKNPETK